MQIITDHDHGLFPAPSEIKKTVLVLIPQVSANTSPPSSMASVSASTPNPNYSSPCAALTTPN
jgi:hypothetical protein